MRNVKFKLSGMENFCNYIDPIEISFEEGKLILVTGPNGCGKTTLLQSIPFTLYGITSDGMRGDDVVNNKIEKNCHTWVHFDVDEDKYLIDRYHKHSKYGNIVILNKNGVDIKKGQREVLPEIEKIIAPRKLFSNTLLFGQNVKDFFTDLTDTEKKDIFRKVLQLDEYVEYYDETNKRLKESNLSITNMDNEKSIKISLLNDAKTQILTLNKIKIDFETKKIQDIRESKDRIKELEKHKNIIEEKISKYNQEDLNIDDIKKEIFILNQKLSNINIELTKSKNSIEEQKKIKESEFKNSVLESREKINEEFSILEKENRENKEVILDEFDKKINEKDNEINKLNNEIFQIDVHKNSLSISIQEIIDNVIDSDISICPTCKQEINEETKGDLKKEIDNSQLKIKELDQKISINNEEILKIKELKSKIIFERTQKDENFNSIYSSLVGKKQLNLKNIQDRLVQALAKLENIYEEQIDNSKKDSKEEEKEIQENLNILEKEEEIKNDLITKFEELKKNVKDIDHDIDTINVLIREKGKEEYDKTQLISYIKKVGNIEDEIKNLEIDKNEKIKEIERLEFWKKGFSSVGIPSLLIDDSIPFLNQRVSYYLDLISNGRYIVSFDTLDTTKSGEFRDKIAVNVLDNNSKANSRIQLSGGQTRLVDIATILTLNDLQSNVQDMSFNLLLFDEIFDALDSENTRLVSNVLRRSTSNKSVVIISHRHVDQLEADEILELY